MTGDPVQRWEPPAEMKPAVAVNWRVFYRHAYITYGVTPEHYRALYLSQLGRCYVCRVAKGVHPDDPNGRGLRRLAIDHCHALGFRNPWAVRGLLCSGGDRTCNRIIGWLKDDPRALDRAAVLLREMPARRVLTALEEGKSADALKGALVE